MICLLRDVRSAPPTSLLLFAELWAEECELFDAVETYAQLDDTWGCDANINDYTKMLDVVDKYIEALD